MKGREGRRNTVIYLGQILYGTACLPIVIIALMDVYQPSATVNAIDPNTYNLVRGLICIQAILFLAELFY